MFLNLHQYEWKFDITRHFVSFWQIANFRFMEFNKQARNSPEDTSYCFGPKAKCYEATWTSNKCEKQLKTEMMLSTNENKYFRRLFGELCQELRYGNLEGFHLFERSRTSFCERFCS